MLQLIELGGLPGSHDQRLALVTWARRVLDGVERRLAGRTWIAAGDFTVADILLATVLRQLRGSDLLVGFPRVRAYYERAMARPAWQRALERHADRLGVRVDDIR